MNGIVPVVRHLILCEDIRVDPTNPQQVSLVNLVSRIRSTSDPPYPMSYPQLCVFAQLTGCRGTGRVAIRITQPDGTRVSSSAERTVNLGTDPLAVVDLRLRMRACPFPAAGLYFIQFCYNGVSLAEEPL